MYERVKQDVAALGLPTSLTNTLLGELYSIEPVIFEANLRKNYEAISATSLHNLKILAEMLPNDSLATNDLDELNREIVSLFEKIRDSDIDDLLKKSLLEFARTAMDSIRRFQIHGKEGLESALKSMIGELGYLYKTSSTEEMHALKEQGFFEKMNSIVDRTGKLVSLAEKTKPILESMGKLLCND